MATLILSTIGNAMGGPMGAALGAMVGQSIDQALLGPAPRQSGRLDDLRLQSSRYGTPVPRVFGTMRVAGSVIWSTDLIEQDELQGGYKGQSEVQVYHYRASFAVALSSRRARGVGRIWADGQLLRGAAGDFKVPIGAFRFCDGNEDQPVDPLIGSIEGEAAPAYRGLSLAVFEDLDLGAFGNRIPMLSFELIADEAPTDVAAMLHEVSDGQIDGPSLGALDGYALAAPSLSEAVTGIQQLMGFAVRPENGGGLLVPGDAAATGPAWQATRAMLGCGTDGGDPLTLLNRIDRAARTLPRRLTIGYHDAQRDYQAGLSEAQAGGGTADLAFELPGVLDAATARQWAEQALARAWQDRERLDISLPPDAAAIAIGDTVEVEGVAGRWQVVRREIERWAVRTELRRVAPSAARAPTADSGRAAVASDRAVLPTQLAVAEVDDGTGAMTLTIAGATAGAWRPVPVRVSVNGTDIGRLQLNRAAAIGTVRASAWHARTALVDRGSWVEVELCNPDMTLTSADDDALAMGANLALVGEELIQFGRAEPIGIGRYRLSNLMRGRQGSEWACDHAPSGERFLLCDAGRFVRLAIDPTYVGAELTIAAEGIGDTEAAPLRHVFAGESARPLMPVGLSGAWTAEGGLAVRWSARSRAARSWTAVAQAPAHRISVHDATGAMVSEVESDTGHLVLDAAQLPATGAVTIRVAARGAANVSRAAEMTIDRP